jgi:hypothetical protein
MIRKDEVSTLIDFQQSALPDWRPVILNLAASADGTKVFFTKLFRQAVDASIWCVDVETKAIRTLSSFPNENMRVIRTRLYTADGPGAMRLQYDRSMIAQATEDPCLAYLHGITVSANGSVFVLDENIYSISENGTTCVVLDSNQTGVDPADLAEFKGALFIADANHHRIVLAAESSFNDAVAALLLPFLQASTRLLQCRHADLAGLSAMSVGPASRIIFGCLAKISLTECGLTAVQFLNTPLPNVTIIDLSENQIMSLSLALFTENCVRLTVVVLIR